MKTSTVWLLPLAALATTTTAAESAKLNAVEEVFRRSWNGYREHAWGHDSLRPISNSYADDRNGWGATAVDALGTAIIMGLDDVVDDILNYIKTIDFSKTDTEISLFETTIRYLGGMLSAYDLLKGPYKRSDLSAKAVNVLLEQSVVLADNLKVAFNTTSGLPDNNLFFDPEPRVAGSWETGLAVAGTLILEWERLSDLTGDREYGNLVKRAENYLLNPQPPENEPFPGLMGSRLFVENGTFADNIGSWGGGSDSFYEYLIKMYIYDPDRFEFYRDRWVVTAESSIEYLASHPTTRPELTFLAMFSGTEPQFYFSHLGCFSGGNFILGGLVLKEQRYVDFGLDLTAGCHETYVQTSSGIGPELFQWQDKDTPLDAGNNHGPETDAQREFYKDAGFWIMNSQYVLRPEVIESYYYAYRATGDEMYREWAWDAFVSINRTCSVGSGLSAINNVMLVDGKADYQDFQESFLFAEVMKYIYLILSDDSDVQVKKDGKNLFVFNTEAHPIKVLGS
ncbi:related to class I alpha-mannosidase 1B [Cephalotrichum gorgonifer]|uniref:alpha-1,2-Mannosidase n=1 Tax=Cephalotrichum gorgonifer TaxID=2041049 RepID=A0AAE8SW65_9PEZI|nr:related to class I alpha-mannosidase 1B [Cephalotrichum gorgonifer]